MSDRNSALVPHVSPPAILSAHNARGYVSLQVQWHREAAERKRRLIPAPTPIKRRVPDPQIVAANEAVRDHLLSKGKFPVRDIQMACARYYGVSLSDIVSLKRDADLVKPRHVAIYLARTLTVRSSGEIGKQFRRKDHTTIPYVVRKLKDICIENAVLRGEIEILTLWLRGESGCARVPAPTPPGRRKRGRRERGQLSVSNRVLAAIRDGHSHTASVARALRLNARSVRVAMGNLTRFGKINHVGRVRIGLWWCKVYAVAEGEA